MEVTVENCSPLIRPGCVAAFQLATGLGDSDDPMPPDRIGIVAEVRDFKLAEDELAKLFQAMRHSVAEGHGLQVQRIVLVHPRTIPKTTVRTPATSLHTILLCLMIALRMCSICHFG